MNVGWTIAIATLGLAALGLAGCAATPDPLEGDYSQEFFPREAGDEATGTRVRWGGTIIETRPQQDRTCVEILAQELDSSFRPKWSDQDRGRFKACRESFMDPEIFVNGRDVTVVGELESFTTDKVGEFDYRYPVVDANSVYLWPERADRGYYGYPYYGYPYYGYPYYGGFYYPYFHHGFGHGFYGGFHRGGFIYREGSDSVRGSVSTSVNLSEK
ncbi:MAG: Slp family lipoprotein [Wenzhouxiangellaceae bacterium]|nr:Slp family lipoprotein [Wenzhouxiangellaceae bacterium]